MIMLLISLRGVVENRYSNLREWELSTESRLIMEDEVSRLEFSIKRLKDDNITEG